jgi:hypothetical protein
MRWLCFFLRCRWRHVMNATGMNGLKSVYDPMGMRLAESGIYQCARGKTISIGSPRP